MSTGVVLRRERVYLVLVAAVSALVYFALTVSVLGLVLATVGYLAFALSRAIAIGFLRGNGVLATADQFPELATEADAVARELGMVRTPNVWIFQAGRILDALTRRFVRGHHVVLASEIAELRWEGEEHRRGLRFLLAHEFARVQRQFPLWGVLVAPGRFTPILGKAWSRASALTFDRIAARVEPAGAAPGLSVFAAGPRLSETVERDRFAAQARRRGFWAWAFELVSRKRPLARRMHHLDQFCARQAASAVQPAGPGRTWSWDRVIAAVLVLSAVPAGVAVLVLLGPELIDQAREAAMRAEDAFRAQVGMDEQCPPGMTYDTDLEFCYTE